LTGPAPSGPPNPFVGWLLVVFGGLMALLCGACTVQVIADSILGFKLCRNLPPTEECGPAMLASDPIFSICVALIIGGAPTIIGIFVSWAGWRALRQSRRTQHESGTPND
jgi:hypothetical protein